MSKGRYRVTVIEAGLSKNRTFYPDSTLRNCFHMFESARVFAVSDREHRNLTGKDFRNLVGRIVHAEFAPGPMPDTGSIVAVLELIDADDAIARKIANALGKGMTDIFGLSIAVDGRSRPGPNGTRFAEAFTKIHSVDLIVEPGAGGRVVSFTEAAGTRSQGPVMNREEIIQLIQATRPDALEGKDVNALTDVELTDILKALLKPHAPDAAIEAPAVMAEAVRDRLRQRITASGLPEAAKQKLRGEVAANVVMTEAHVTARIGEEGRYLSAAGLGGGHVQGLGGYGVGDGPREKGAAMLDAFFDPANKSVRSFRECYVQLTGDDKLTGRAPRSGRFTEALSSTSFPDALGDAITRRVLTEYANTEIYDVWRDLANVVPVNDFRKQERVLVGGYGDLEKVAERAPYLQVASPTDQKAEYTAEKRGGIETVSIEMVANDDVGVISRIPIKMAVAAKRTLSKFVMGFLQSNAPIYDGKALFHLDHRNLMSEPLTAEAAYKMRGLIREQRERDSNEKIGLTPRFLWVPDALEGIAYDIFQRQANNDPTFTQSLGWKLRPVWCWTDSNDWCVSTDPRELPAIEVGFFQGAEEPEIFVQDVPTAGMFFTNDIISYKIRHIYGAAVTDHRAVAKSVVAA